MTALRPLLIITLYACSTLLANAAEVSTEGKIVGSKPHSHPDWFKQSFLEIAEDVDEASAEGKHVMLFFDLDGCPYCDRMLQESFNTEPHRHYIQSNFDVIAVNVRGNLDIAFNEETIVTESELADILNVRATPALLFFNENNESVVRVDGYRAPERFQQVLEYVATRSYRSTDLAGYLQAKLDRDAYQLRDNSLFTETNDLSTIEGPLMLVFEDGSCYDCDELHDGLFTDERVLSELDPYTIVRLDADSQNSIIDFNGNETTPAALAAEYEMLYRPGIMLFDDSKLLRRHDSLLYPHHMMESLRYIGRGFHKDMDYRSFTRQFRDEILQAGGTIDYARAQLKD